MTEATLEARLRRIREAGFEGAEIGVPDTPAACVAARDVAGELGLELVVQQWTQGRSAAEHADSFERQYERAASVCPVHVNSHTGKDWRPLAWNLEIFDRAARLEAAAGVPVLHETHRGRALFSVPSTVAVLAARPDLKLTADFSHWCCVHESLLEDQAETVARAIDRSFYIHARIGHSQGPQITDPRAPGWDAELGAHLRWWKAIGARLRREGREVRLCPEFGPPPYMTRESPADLGDLNGHMRDWLRTELAD